MACRKIHTILNIQRNCRLVVKIIKKHGRLQAIYEKLIRNLNIKLENQNNLSMTIVPFAYDLKAIKTVSFSRLCNYYDYRYHFYDAGIEKERVIRTVNSFKIYY